MGQIGTALKALACLVHPETNRTSSFAGKPILRRKKHEFFLKLNVSACIKRFGMGCGPCKFHSRGARIMIRNFFLKLALLLASVALCALTLGAQVRIAGGI